MDGSLLLHYFDLRDGDVTVSDEEGLELRDLLAVQEKAARALAGLSWAGALTLRDKARAIS